MGSYVTESERDTYNIVSKIAYLIGVEKRHFEAEYEAPKLEVFEELEQNQNARRIRDLSMLRTALEQNFSAIRQQMECGLKNLQDIPALIPQDCLKRLASDGVEVIKANCRTDQYIIRINKLICDHVNGCKTIFPDWVEWKYLRELFIMPGGQSECGIRKAAREYYANRNRYPYQVYINWTGEEAGNILYNDRKFLTLLYAAHKDTFCATDKVTDACASVKNDIVRFLESNRRIVVMVDCENSDPYKLCAVLNDLSGQGVLDSFVKIVLCDDVHTSTAWDILEHYTRIPVEHYLTRRISKNKSIVDQSLCVKACQEHYENHADAIILFGSDSDYWGLFSLLRTVNYYVMAERAKFGSSHRQALEEAGIPYCCIDSFCTDNSSQIKVAAMLKEVRTALKGALRLNITDVLHNACLATRAEMSRSEREQFYERYIKSMRLVIGSDGELGIVIG